ncbi:MAG TPA: PH domain-containing protein [Ktedonobacteraceae bacterium]|nr:PH domain-containing protein [Ktedonobacteraceae bacterium]
MNQNNQKQEQVIIDTRPYAPLFFLSIRPILGVIATIALCVLAPITRTPIFLLLALLPLLYVILWFIFRWIRWLTIRLTITDRVVIYRWYNWQLTKKQREFPLDRITSVDTSQNLFERILGAGDLVLKTPTGEEAIADVPHVDNVRDTVVELMRYPSN